MPRSPYGDKRAVPLWRQCFAIGLQSCKLSDQVVDLFNCNDLNVIVKPRKFRNFTVCSQLEGVANEVHNQQFMLILKCLKLSPAASDRYQIFIILNLSFWSQSHLFNHAVILNLTSHSQSNLFHLTVILNIY